MKKKEILIVLFVLTICISATILPNYLNNLDEIWNFNFARSVAEGRLPYGDFNMIQTPLLPIIAGTIMWLVGVELIVMRFLAIILCVAIMFMAYKILRLLEINGNMILLSMIAIFLLFSNYFRIDYNFATLLVVLITLYNEIKKVKNGNELLVSNYKFDFSLGLLIGTTILFKQTTGLFITFIFVLYKLVLASKKEEFKVAFKIVSARFLGIIIPVIILFLYLIINNIWAYFLDYAVFRNNDFFELYSIYKFNF